MAYDEQETKQSRVVVDTPSARREVTQTERAYTPAPEGTSGAAIAALVILGVAVIALLGLLFWNMQTNNANLAAQAQPTPQTIVQQPAQQPPIIVQQPAQISQPAPVIVNPPAPAGGGNVAAVSDDSKVQAAIDKKLQGDTTLSTLNVTASVLDGKVLLVGSVKSGELKAQVEKSVLAIKGVKSVDNQISVSSS